MSVVEYKNYLCEYPYAGSVWGFNISATSREDAEARLRAMPWAEVKGEIVARIPVMPSRRFFDRFFKTLS